MFNLTIRMLSTVAIWLAYATAVFFLPRQIFALALACICGLSTHAIWYAGFIEPLTPRVLFDEDETRIE